MELYKKMVLSWAKETARQYNMEYITIINGEKSSNSEETFGITLELKDSYFNSKNVLKNYPTNFALIEKAYEIAGVKMFAESGRGGSDVGDITYLGIPTYNMFGGSHNEHSADEWVSSKQMLASYNVALNYLKLMAAQNREQMLNEGHTAQVKIETDTIVNKIDIDKVFQKINDEYNQYPFSDIK